MGFERGITESEIKVLKSLEKSDFWSGLDEAITVSTSRPRRGREDCTHSPAKSYKSKVDYISKNEHNSFWQTAA